MSNAREAARRVVEEYSIARGMRPLAGRAERFLKAVLVSRVDHHWQRSESTETALEILNEAVIDMDDLAEYFLGINLSFESLQRFDERAEAAVYGMARPNAREITICERTLEYLPLYRATLAHEIGHVILHGSLEEQLAYSPRSRKRPRKELDADQFMSELVLPDPVLFVAVAYIAQMNGISLYEAMREANRARGRWQWKNIFFAPIIDTLCVSRELIAVRMRMLELFSQETLDYHRSYHLENKWLKKSKCFPLARVMQSVFDRL